MVSLCKHRVNGVQILPLGHKAFNAKILLIEVQPEKWVQILPLDLMGKPLASSRFHQKASSEAKPLLICVCPRQ